MSGSHVVSLLTKKYAKLLGEHEFAERMTEDAIGLDAIIEVTNQCDRRKKEIDEKLQAIETVIWLFEPNWNPAIVRPNYPRKQHLTRGAFSRAIYSILREAKLPLTRRELARTAASRLGIEKMDEQTLARLESQAHILLKGREGKTVRVTSHNPMRWIIIPKEMVTAGTNRRKAPQPKIGIVSLNLEARKRPKHSVIAPQAPSEMEESPPSAKLPSAS